MADSSEAIRRLTIVTSAPGADQAAASLNNVAKSMDGVTVASTNTDKATLSLDQKFASMERRYVTSVRAQQDYEKTQRLVNQAVAQNPALQERANALLAAAKDRHDQLAGSQKALGVIASDLNSRIQASAGAAGVAGQALTALGPAGLAVAAAMGLAATGFYAASAGAHELAAKARELKDFSESTGLTVNQVQALRSEATKFGVDSDTLQAGLQKFTTGFQDLRLGTGDLLTQIRRINPALADEMAQATDTATAFTLFGRAVAQTTNIFERNALARAGLGKGGPTVAEFLGNVGDVKALASAYDAAGKGLQSNMIDKLKDLDLQIAKTTGNARQNLSSIFAQPVLEAELGFAKGFLSVSETAKNFQLSSDAQSFFGTIAKGVPVIGPWISFFTSLRQAGQKGANDNGAAALAVSDAVPRTRTFDQIVADQNKANAGPTPEKLAADWRNYIAVLGSAATPTERLNAQIAELGVKAKEAGVGADALGRGIAGLKLDDAIARQAAHNSALGAAASVADLVKAKTLELQKAQQQGANLTDAQIANQKRLAAENALGITQIKASADAYMLEAQTIGMSEGAAASYAAVQNKINQAKRDGQPLTQENINAITREAQALGQAVQSTANLKFGYDTLQSATQAFGQNLRNGQNAWDAFKNAGVTALGTIADKLMKIATDNLWNAAFGGSSGLGGLLGSLFGGGGGGAAQAASASTLAGNTGGAFFGPGFADGGYTGGGGRNEPAGIVHRGEYVFDAASTSRIGVPRLNSLRGYADGGLVTPAGNVTTMPGSGQDNAPTMIFNYSPVIDARGADAAAVARLASVVAKQQQDFERNVQAVVGKTRQNRPGAFG